MAESIRNVCKDKRSSFDVDTRLARAKSSQGLVCFHAFGEWFVLGIVVQHQGRREVGMAGATVNESGTISKIF